MRVLVVIAVAICACSGRQPESLADPTGQVAARELVGSAYGDPLPGLTAEEQGQFEEGRIAFIENQDAPHGLGPVFNSTSCQSCHDGPPAVGGTNQRLEIRFGRRNPDGSFDPLTSLGGSLLQDHGIGAVPGYNYVAEVVPPQANVVASRRTQPLFGLGLVDATPEATFRALAELQAKQDPEVAGRPAMVPEIATGKLAVGRFGWKGSTPTLFQFSGDAYLNEMGLTNPQFPAENCPQGDCAALSHNPMPGMNDLDGRAVAKSANFMAFLGPPPRGRTSLRSTYGQAVFGSIGCAFCHVPTLVTGSAAVRALDRVAYHPFSDFLVHDMGALGDGIGQGDARPSEMRTQPLWGLSPQTRLLHDGRATTVSEAILAHDGQGRKARDAFAGLGSFDRAALLAFLGTL